MSTVEVQGRNVIGGVLVEAEDGQRLDVIEPATGAVLATVPAGCVWINDHLPIVSELPHGGFKQSGYGKDLSVYGLEDYTQIKHVMAKVAGWKKIGGCPNDGSWPRRR
jgi:acyl-CoA reductase-like NAD-dependent aldehyde dehydrogenase